MSQETTKRYIDTSKIMPLGLAQNLKPGRTYYYKDFLGTYISVVFIEKKIIPTERYEYYRYSNKQFRSVYEFLSLEDRKILKITSDSIRNIYEIIP
jgi:hypothetical protein